MSWQATKWVFRQLPNAPAKKTEPIPVVLDPSVLVVLLYLAEKASADGRDAYPSVRTIAAKTGQSYRGVQRALATLKAGGWIAECVPHPEPKCGTTNYRLCIEREVLVVAKRQTEGRSSQAGASPASPLGASLVSPREQGEGATPSTPEGRQARHSGGDTGVAQTTRGTAQETTPTPGGEGGEGQEAGSPLSRPVAQAHGIVADLAAARGLPAPSTTEVQKLAREFPDADLVGVALKLADDAPNDMRSTVGLFRSRLAAAPISTYLSREDMLAHERKNREDRERRMAAYEAEYEAKRAAS